MKIKLNSQDKPTVLVIDDSPQVLMLISNALMDEFNIKVANSASRAITLASTGQLPDMILLDVLMPDMNGFEICHLLKSNPKTAEIPIIFLTSMTGEADETRGFELGAVDYVTKPISIAILKARISSQLELKNARDLLNNENHLLEAEVHRRVCEISTIQDVTIFSLATLAEARDNDTGNHIRRTQLYVKVLAENHRFNQLMKDQHAIDLLSKSAALHDIGKVGIPDNILLKPGPLDPSEFEIMKQHPTIGKESIEKSERALGVECSFLQYAKEIAYCHHEKWDGSGYPQGLRGEEIPFSARLMALADVYDALISKRVYKAAMPHDKARDIIIAGKNSHFDPEIVDVFLREEKSFQEIARKYADVEVLPG